MAMASASLITPSRNAPFTVDSRSCMSCEASFAAPIASCAFSKASSEYDFKRS